MYHATTMTTTKKSPPKPITPDLWMELRSIYVFGKYDEEGKRSDASLAELALEYGVCKKTLERRCLKEGWVAQRTEYEEESQRELIKLRARHTARSFDRIEDLYMRAADAAHKIAVKRLEKLSESDDIVDEMSKVSVALSSFYKNARLAHGVASEITKVERPHDADLDAAMHFLRTGAPPAGLEQDKGGPEESGGPVSSSGDSSSGKVAGTGHSGS